jgi:hypothetical protein
MALAAHAADHEAAVALDAEAAERQGRDFHRRGPLLHVGGPLQHQRQHQVAFRALHRRALQVQPHVLVAARRRQRRQHQRPAGRDLREGGRPQRGLQPVGMVDQLDDAVRHAGAAVDIGPDGAQVFVGEVGDDAARAQLEHHRHPAAHGLAMPERASQRSASQLQAGRGAARAGGQRPLNAVPDARHPVGRCRCHACQFDGDRNTVKTPV